MPSLLTFGSASARALGHIGGARKPKIPVSVTINANAAWVCPAGVTTVSLSGKGANGTSEYWEMTAHTMMSCTRSSFNQSGGSVVSKSDAVLDGISAASPMDDGSNHGERFVTWYKVTYTVGPDNLSKRTTPFSTSRRIRGPISLSWGSESGNITHTPSSLTSVTSTVETKYSGTTGASSTGFDRTFPGGNQGPATNTEFANVAVTPGNDYSLVIPTGGQITISYFE